MKGAEKLLKNPKTLKQADEVGVFFRRVLSVGLLFQNVILQEKQVVICKSTRAANTTQAIFVSQVHRRLLFF